MQEIQLFLDCDGCIANFDKFAMRVMDNMPPREFEAEKGTKEFWNRIYSTEDFFFQLDKMDDADELVDAVRHLNPIILTGIPRGDWAAPQKLAWRDKHFPGIPMITCASKDKLLHQIPNKHNILIDDWPKYKPDWEEAGGTFILHTSAKESINTLKEMKIL